MFEMREKKEKKRQSQSGVRQGKGAVVAVGKGTDRGDGVAGCHE